MGSCHEVLLCQLIHHTGDNWDHESPTLNSQDWCRNPILPLPGHPQLAPLKYTEREGERDPTVLRAIS